MYYIICSFTFTFLCKDIPISNQSKVKKGKLSFFFLYFITHIANIYQNKKVKMNNKIIWTDCPTDIRVLKIWLSSHPKLFFFCL